MDLAEYKARYGAGNGSPGWDAIDKRCEALYPGQEPVHFLAAAPAMAGGPDILEGVSVYASDHGPVPHLHYVSYGMSNLHYDEEAVGGEFSRWGFEFTFRLKAKAKDARNNSWPVQLMQNLARYVESTEKWFEEFHFIGTNGPIRADYPTALTAIAFVRDPELGEMETPHGKVVFLQIVGLTTDEFQAELPTAGAGIEALLDRLRTGNPLLVTELDRT